MFEFDRYLPLCVSSCNVLGIMLGHAMADISQAICSSEIGRNLPKVI
jgi:hypothetical protein